ncbi:MAG: hypothetical protein QNK37_11355 [Acidobacteriota bacterium]|nr:hypothetical protein [Acidobacteriota bacterium]
MQLILRSLSAIPSLHTQEKPKKKNAYFFAPHMIPKVDSFTQAVSWGGSLINKFQQEELYLTDIRRQKDAERWFLQIKLPAQLVEEYGTAPEALILATPEAVHGKDLREAKYELLRREFELDRDLLIIADGKPDLEKRLDQIFPLWGQWIPWGPQNGVFPALADCFSGHATGHDIFDERHPVRGRQVFGRDEMVTNLIRHIRRGGAAGVFGLRKVGKTTTVRAATDKLDPPVGGNVIVPVAWLDAERVYERTLDGLVTRLLDTMETKLVREHLYDLPVPREGEPLNRLDRYLTTILQELPTPLCLVIDEYDYLFEGSGGMPGVAGIGSFFNLIRGHAQETSQLSLVLIGRDPGHLDQPLMDGRPNPLLGWFADYWPGPLNAVHAEQLLTGLGRRIRLKTGPKTIREAYLWSGGHPMLLRQFGSTLVDLADRTGPQPMVTDPLITKAADAYLERNAVTTICREVYHLLSTRYPRAAELTAELVNIPDDGLQSRLAKIGSNEALLLLKRFGLLIEHDAQVMIPRVFRWYFTAMTGRSRRQSA